MRRIEQLDRFQQQVIEVESPMSLSACTYFSYTRAIWSPRWPPPRAGKSQARHGFFAWLIFDSAIRGCTHAVVDLWILEHLFDQRHLADES